MKNVEAVIRALSDQTVRLDLATRWANGYKVQRSLIGIVHASRDTFSVEESFPGGEIVVMARYNSVRSVRVDSDPGGFVGVISIDTTIEEDLDE